MRNVARGMLAAYDKGRRGQRYILGGENLSYRDMIVRVAQAAGVPPLSVPSLRRCGATTERLS